MKVAVVTGSNKGIGFAIVRGLCKQFQGEVFLTARNEELGKQAVCELEKEGIHPKFHQLDITDVSSINKLKDFLVDQYGGLDLLVNNAGIAYKVNSTAPFAEQAEVTMKTNFIGTLNVCNALFPILKSGARVVHVSSMASHMVFSKCTDDLKSKLKGLKTIAEVEECMAKYVELVKTNQHHNEGWPDSAYGTSKVGTTLMTPIQQREIEKDATRSDIVINACCPGYVATDMSSFKGHKTIDEGADTPLYLALLPPNVTSPKGDFVSDRQIKNLH